MAPLLMDHRPLLKPLLSAMRSKSSVWRSISLWISCRVDKILLRIISSIMAVPPFVFSLEYHKSPVCAIQRLTLFLWYGKIGRLKNGILCFFFILSSHLAVIMVPDPAAFGTVRRSLIGDSEILLRYDRRAGQLSADPRILFPDRPGGENRLSAGRTMRPGDPGQHRCHPAAAECPERPAGDAGRHHGGNLFPFHRGCQPALGRRRAHHLYLRYPVLSTAGRDRP